MDSFKVVQFIKLKTLVVGSLKATKNNCTHNIAVVFFFLFFFFFFFGYKVAALNTWISRNVGGSFTYIYLDKARVRFQSHIINNKKKNYLQTDLYLRQKFLRKRASRVANKLKKHISSTRFQSWIKYFLN